MSTDTDALPTWKAMTFRSAAFLAVWLVGLSIAVKLLTGTWGGQPDDPLWVGPVSAAAGLVFAVASTVGYIAANGLADTSPRAIRTACGHAGAVPVESAITGEVLAMLCPECDSQLPATFAEAVGESTDRL